MVEETKRSLRGSHEDGVPEVWTTRETDLVKSGPIDTPSERVRYVQYGTGRRSGRRRGL